MANQPKKYQKFVATAATATLVASAIVPVASANAGFTDITNYDAKVQGYINDLADRGIIKGTSETTFAPSTHISRGQVVKLLGRYLEEEQGYEIPEDWEDSRFKDVDVTKDAELAKYAALVYDAGVFTGNNGNLEATKKISRQNMAVVLDRAVEAITGTSLVELAAETGEEADVADLDTAKESARDAIEALNILGISTVENFNPLNNVSRANFAKFLYLTIEQIGGIDYVAELEAALEALAELGEVTEDNAEEAQELVDAAQAALDAAVEAEAIDEEDATAAQAEIDAVQAAIDAIVGESGEGVISQVSAINGTTVEVTLEEAVTAAPAASAFSIPGLTVQKVEIKPESDNRVLVLTTSAQTPITYTLTYAGASEKFIGKNALGTVILKADKERVEIDPNLNTLPTVGIQVELSTDFPAGAEAVIEFETSFGQVVKVQTTKGGKTSFTLTPEKTLFSQVARVTGKVVEVKNPTTGQTYPEYRNATVNTVNVQFDVKPNVATDTVEVFQFKTAYAEQADRVVLRVDGSGVTENMAKTLANAPLAKVAQLTNSNIVGQQTLSNEAEVAKEFYTLLHDVVYSNTSALVEAENAKYLDTDPTKRITKSEAIKNAEKAINDFLDDLKAEDLRNVLYKDTIGTVNNYEAKYKKFGYTPEQLYKAINDNFTDNELKGIIDYYKLLSKFVVLDNVRDTEAPQSPNNIFAVEHVYAANNNTLVLVLPGDRADAALDKDGKITKTDAERIYNSNDRYEQNRDAQAKALQDNVSHQVVFLNNIEKDRYQLTGAPTFKLEDANDVKLISVDGDALRYKVGSATTAQAAYCPIPFSIDVKEDSINTNPGNSSVSYSGEAIPAKNYTISDYFMKYDEADKNLNPDKLGEVLVVFSESVRTTKGTNSVLNPANWTVDGVNLDEAVKEFGGKVQIRLVSTDVNKQLRDAVIITFASDNKKEFKPADKFDTTLIDKFIEKAVYGDKHKLEVSKLGDWAAVTDDKNIVPTQTLDYARTKEATAWGTTTKGASNTQPLLPNSDAFVVRAAGQADVTNGITVSTTDDKDIVRILFSEPMKQDGADSVLNKENYKINGKELPVDKTSIRVGLAGVEGLENSPCAVTIELPQGTLSDVKGINGNDNVIAVSNVRGYDDTRVLQSDLQLAYARSLTLTNDNGNSIIVENYGTFTKDEHVALKYNAAGNISYIPYGGIKNVTSVKPTVYYKDGKVLEFTHAWVNSEAFFLTHPEGANFTKAGSTPGTKTPAELAAPVITAINALPATIALTDKAAIEAARAAYNALSADAKAAVTNLDKLVAAEAALAKLEAPGTTKTVADLNGKVAADNLLGTYVVRIPAGDMNPESKLTVTVDGTDYVLTYDADRKVFSNGVIKAANAEAVLAASVKVEAAETPEEPETPEVPTFVVSEVGGKVAKDNLLGTFVVRIPAAKVDATEADTLVLTVNGKDYELAYDADRKIFANGTIVAKSVDEVLASTFIVK